MDDLTTQASLTPICRGFTPGFVNYKKGCTRLAATSDKVYQLLAHGQWFFPGTLAFSTTNTESGLNTKNQSINQSLLVRDHQKPVIAHLVFNLTSKDSAKWKLLVTKKFESWPAKDHFISNFSAEDFYVIFSHNMPNRYIC